MEDREIIDLYFDRSESALIETKNKYGRLLFGIAYGILRSMQDAEECENDTYLRAWNAIPPERPSVFSAFLSKITRNLSLDRYEKNHAQKRGSGEVALALDELAECIPGAASADPASELALKDLLNDFLAGLGKDARVMFMRRYWFGDPVADIAKRFNCGESRVKMSLSRSRKALKAALEEGGFAV